MNLTLRQAREGDAATLRQVLHASVHGLASRDYTPEQCAAWAPADYDTTAWAQRLAGLTTWVAERNGMVAGFASLRDDGYVDFLYVAPAHAGCGVGSALMRAVLERAKEQGCPVLWSDVSETARPCFSHHGFTVQARQQLVREGVALHNYRMRHALI
ncbi:GNAT family N-acetyltransferase [Chitinolyticbacter albus]|uniref:GNAT family N-acetyltransferase n=1 Tax=Chitinolyticbacter albus TaxID=2961951 RepID=UPI002108FA03|nr:GNAT family N-acetyltransferase [Chitinolyticbacter albus]